MANDRFCIRNGWTSSTGVIGLVIAVLLWRGITGLFTGRVLGAPTTDIRTFFLPLWHFVFSVLREGQFPLWNPYILGGTPSFAAGQTQALYPPSLLTGLFLPPHAAITVTIGVHVFLAGTFNWFFARDLGLRRGAALLSAVIYACAGTTVLRIYAGHVTILCTICWLPLIMFGVRRLVRTRQRRWSGLIGFALGLQLLAGQPQYLVYTLGAASLYLLWLLGEAYGDGRLTKWQAGQGALLFAAAVIGGGLLAAVQLLPGLELARQSSRQAETFAWMSQFSLPPANVLTFLVPDAFGNRGGLPYWGKLYLWEASVYCGVTTLVLVPLALARRRRGPVLFFFLLAIIALVYALGRHTPFLNIVYLTLPPLRIFRGSAKAVFVCTFALSILAGYGADLLMRDVSGRGRLCWVAGLTAGVGVAGLLALLLFPGEEGFARWIRYTVQSGDMYHDPALFTGKAFAGRALRTFRSSAALSLVWVGAAGVWIALRLRRVTSPGLFAGGLFVLATAELLLSGMRYTGTFEADDLVWPESVVAFLERQPSPVRIYAPPASPNSSMLHRLQSPVGYDAVLLRRYSRYMNISQRKPARRAVQRMVLNRFNALTDMLNIRYVVMPADVPLEAPFLTLCFSDESWAVYRNANALPRAFVVDTVQAVEDAETIPRKLIEENIDIRARALIERPLPQLTRHDPDGATPLSRGKADVQWYGMDRVEVQADLERDGLLVLADPWYPGWRVEVDGEPVGIVKVNYLFRGVPLPAGSHRAVFRYRPRSFVAGAALSLLALAGLAGFCVPWRDLVARRIAQSRTAPESRP